MCRHRAISAAHSVGTTHPDSLVQPSRRPHYQQSVPLCFGPVCLGLGIVGRGGEGLLSWAQRAGAALKIVTVNQRRDTRRGRGTETRQCSLVNKLSLKVQCPQLTSSITLGSQAQYGSLLPASFEPRLLW